MALAVIVTAINDEYLAVKSHLKDLQEERHLNGTIYKRGKFADNGQECEVVIVQVAQGNISSVSETERVITHFKNKNTDVDIILFVGVAGGIKDVFLGDVVVSSKVHYYESGEEGKTPKVRADSFQSNSRLLNIAKAKAQETDWNLRGIVSSGSDPKIHIAPTASGEKIVKSLESRLCQTLQETFGNAIAVDTESFGFLQAVHNNFNVPALVIRGISDLIDNKTETDNNGYQAIAARHASVFAFKILAKFLFWEKQQEQRDISIDVSPLYRKLSQLLKNANWKEADKETAKLMLQISVREEQRFLDSRSLQNFSCSDLCIIDKLWQDYSQKVFGFSVQKSIYQSINARYEGTKTREEITKIRREIWSMFGEKIGWRNAGSWLAYSQLNPTLNSPKGHFPAAECEQGNLTNDEYGKLIGLGQVWFADSPNALFDRLDSCKCGCGG